MMGDRASAVQFYNQAVTAAQDSSNPNHLQIAYQLFSSACMTDPTLGQAFYQSGNNNSDLNCLHAAIANWRRALQCEMTDEERAKALVNLGWRLHSLGREQEALEASRAAIALQPNLALAWLNLSLIYGIMDDDIQSVLAARRAFELDPSDVHNEIALAFALLFAGSYQEGFKHFEKRFEWRLKNFLQFPYPKWEGEADRTVYLVADQGLGDTLSFARFVERACKRAKYVHAAVQSELLRVFMHAFAHIPNLNLLPQPHPFPAADCWTTFVSLPYALKLDDKQIRDQQGIDLPYFQMPSNWKVPGRKLHIGIAWAGSPLNDIDKHRNIPVTQFFELYRVPDIQLYSLQVGERSKELQDAGGAALVRDLSPYLRDVCDTLSILRDLDLVITVESALGHIAGAANKECWIPYSFAGRDWRIGNRDDRVLWYPKHRTFRQDEDMRWDGPFEMIEAALRRKLGG